MYLQNTETSLVTAKLHWLIQSRVESTCVVKTIPISIVLQVATAIGRNHLQSVVGKVSDYNTKIIFNLIEIVRFLQDILSLYI